MADQPRSLRNLREDIAYSLDKLKCARQDGGCEAIQFWAARFDELIDRLPRDAQQPQGTAS